MTFAPVAALLLALQAPPTQAADSLLSVASERSIAALEARASVAPTLFRDAVTRGLARASKATDGGADDLARARRLAQAYEAARGDDFLRRLVDRFEGEPPSWRAGKLLADSLRRAGSTAYETEGFGAALPLWRESLARATALADTFAMAAAQSNIGAGFLAEGALDSAEVALRRARRLARLSGDLVAEGNALGILHFVSLDRGDVLGARALLDSAVVLRRRTGDDRGAAADLNSLGLLAWELGDLTGARRSFEAALDLNRRAGREAVAATNLTNVAGLSELEGDFAHAVALYREALSVYEREGRSPDVADVLWALGRLDLRRGDYVAGRSHLEEAATILDRTGPEIDWIRVRRELAGALAAMGDLQGALRSMSTAAARARSVGAPADVTAGLALAEADLAVALNDFTRAERLYGTAARLYAEAGDPSGQAEARQGEGALLLEREDFTRAAQRLSGAARVQEANGNARGAAITRTLLAQAFVGRGDRAGARRLLEESVAELARLGDPVAEAYTISELGRLEAEDGALLAADSLFAAALERLGDRPAADVRWRVHFGRGLAARAAGALDAAARELRVAARQIEAGASVLVLPERRSAYRSDKAEVHAQLALTELRRGRIGAAFEASEALRARQMVELLSGGRIERTDGVAGNLVAREQDLRRRIAELAREVEPPADPATLLRGPSAAPASVAAAESLARARAAYAELLLEMRERAPRQRDLIEPAPSGWRDVARRLTPGTVLVEYLLTDSGTVAFAVTPDTVVALELGATRTELARLVLLARALIQEPAARAETQWRGPLGRLHAYLVAPLEDAGLLTEAERLVIAPHAELHYLPFAALLDARGRFLVERYVLARAPSASVWLALGDRTERGDAAGILALAPRAGALPGADREVASIAGAGVAVATTLRGPAASEDTFRSLAGRYSVLHLASYGVLNRHNPLFSYIELASAEGDDGRLEVHEVFGLDLAAQLVVLSACETGLGSGTLADVPPGDDWIGLTRAFLYAGADRVMATLWAVDDLATAELVERFYRARRAGLSDGAALADAQRSLIATPGSAHPFHWAGMVLVGQQEGADAR